MRDTELCRKFLETLLQAPVGELSVSESEKQLKFTKDGKAIRLDIYAEEKNTGNIYDAEMQNLNGHSRETLCLPKRSRFYQALIDTRQMEQTKDYSELKDTNVVFICTFDPFGMGLDRYDFEESCRQLPDLEFKSGTKKTFFNTTATNCTLPSNLKSLFDYINEGRVSDELTSEMDEAVERAGADNKVKDEIMRSELILMDMRREGLAEGREIGIKEGRKEGLAQGHAEGLQQGLEQGLQQGLEQGLEQGRNITLINLYHSGILTEAQAIKELGVTPEKFKEMIGSE